jgi:hypothetical protein
MNDSYTDGLHAGYTAGLNGDTRQPARKSPWYMAGYGKGRNEGAAAARQGAERRAIEQRTQEAANLRANIERLTEAEARWRTRAVEAADEIARLRREIDREKARASAQVAAVRGFLPYPQRVKFDAAVARGEVAAFIGPEPAPSRL